MQAHSYRDLIHSHFGSLCNWTVDYSGYKKSQQKLEGSSKKTVDMGRKKTKTMKIGEYPMLDEALYIYLV